MSKLKVGLGYSSHQDSFKAGVEAAKEVIKSHKKKPDILIIFAARTFNHTQLLKGIISITGNIPMVGGTTAGEISHKGFSEQSVVIMSLESKELSFTAGIGKNMSKSEKECAKSLIKNIKKTTDITNPISLLIFPDGMGGDGIQVIQGIQSMLGENFEIVGGYLGDADHFKKTHQYYNGKIYSDSIAGLLICGKTHETGIGVRSGFESIGNQFYCTSAEKNIVYRFDDERALDLYKEFLGKERAKKLPAVCLEYPFGLIDEKVSIEGKEYFQLRCGLAVDHKQGSINLAASIPVGSSVTLTTASRNDIINGAYLAAKQAKHSLKKVKPKAILMFSCIGRKIILGRRTEEEITAVKKVLGNNIPIIGFYTYGEIGPIDKMKPALTSTKFHNETVVLWVLAEK